MDSVSDRLSQEPHSRLQHPQEHLNIDFLTYLPSKQSSSHKILNEHQVSGPIFSQLNFKREIDKVSAKQVEDEVQRSPLIDVELVQKQNTKKTSSSKQFSSQLFQDIDIKNDDLQKNNNLFSNQYLINTRIGSIKQLNEQESEQRLQEQSEEMNHSFDLGDNNLMQKIQRNYSSSTKNKSQGQQQQAQEESEKVNIIQGILSLGVGSNGHKKRGSAIFINQPGISMQNSYAEQRKHSIFSAYQSNQHIDFRYNDSLSPSKLQINDLVSKGMTSEPGTPSIMKRVRNNEMCLQPGGQLQLLNLKQASGYMTGDLTIADKSMGDMSQKREEGFKGIWNKSAFTILTLTKKFINNIKELSMSYKFSQMKRHYFELIGDKANDFEYFHINQKFARDKPNYLQMIMFKWKGVFNKNLYINKIGQNNQAKVILSRLFNLNIGILLPDDFIKIFWDCFILFLLMINLLYIPMKISFSEVTGFNQYLLVFFDDMPSWAFICDVILNFNTAYYSKGVINKERSKIFKHYIRGSFCWDLLVVIPFFFSSVLNVKFLNIILLLRTNKILKIVMSIEELLNLQQFQTCVLNLTKLCITIIYIAHICGCFFYYMHVLQIENDSSTITWVIKFGLQNSGWFSLYISSVYWAVITMITLGYGDLYPVTTLEKIYVIIVTLISCGVFAYAVNAIGYIIQDMTKNSTEFKVKMSSLLNHMKKRKIRQLFNLIFILYSHFF